MKLLAKLSAAALLAFTLAACSDPSADFKKLQAWDKDNAAAQQQIQVDLQQSLSTVKEAKDLEPVLDKYKTQVQSVIDSLDKVDVSSKEVKPLKEKIKAVYLESRDVVIDSLNLQLGGTERTEAAVNALKTKTDTLNADVQALMKLQAELESKYGEKKPAEAAPAKPEATPAPAQEQQPAK
ncbi:hypothetical protein RYD26_11730 [Pasteurellaceae bacterium LIM206]|nr:hypothetical protein [Pasteurellaceae bacterium LIM206]